MISLYPMSYSKRRTVDAIQQGLAEAPEQKPNTPEAFQGKVMEFHIFGQTACGTLTEYAQHMPENEFCLIADDGTVKVQKQGSMFAIKE
jgi:hypothetical protein